MMQRWRKVELLEAFFITIPAALLIGVAVLWWLTSPNF